MVDLNFLPYGSMSIPDRAGNIILTYGDPYGEVAFEKDTLFAGLGRFISDEEAQEVTSSSEASFTWLYSVCQFINYDSVGWQFRDVKMTFPVNRIFSSRANGSCGICRPDRYKYISGGAGACSLAHNLRQLSIGYGLYHRNTLWLIHTKMELLCRRWHR